MPAADGMKAWELRAKNKGIEVSREEDAWLLLQADWNVTVKADQERFKLLRRPRI